jgi:hypothetical protein
MTLCRRCHGSSRPRPLLQNSNDSAKQPETLTHPGRPAQQFAATSPVHNGGGTSTYNHWFHRCGTTNLHPLTRLTAATNHRVQNRPALTGKDFASSSSSEHPILARITSLYPQHIASCFGRRSHFWSPPRKSFKPSRSRVAPRRHYLHLSLTRPQSRVLRPMLLYVDSSLLGL